MHSSIQTPYGVNLPYSCHPRTVFLKHTSTHTCTYRLARKVTGFVGSSLLSHIVLCLVLGDSHIEKSFTRPFNYSSYSDLYSRFLAGCCSLPGFCLSSSFFLILCFLMPFTMLALMCHLTSLSGQSITVITSLRFNPLKKHEDNEISNGMETNGTKT